MSEDAAIHGGQEDTSADTERYLRAERDRLQAAVDKAHAAMHSSAYVGGPSEREAWQTAMSALGEVVTQHVGQAGAVLMGEVGLEPTASPVMSRVLNQFSFSPAARHLR